MVIRENYKCMTCSKEYTFRVSVGHQNEQYFTIRCIDCGQPITIKMILDQENVKACLEPIENCSNSGNEGQFVNIHPNFLIPKRDLFNDGYFPLDQMQVIGEKCSGFINHYCHGKFKDFYKSFSYSRDLVKDYYNRKTIYELVQSGRRDLADERQIAIKRICNQEFSQSLEINNLIDLAVALLMPDYFNRFWDLKKFYRHILKNLRASAAKKFIKKRSLEHLEKFLLALDTFFETFHELTKVSLYIRAGVDLPAASTSASTHFDKIKKVYGDGFEIIMDLALTPAIINNLYMGRSYDKFEKMDIDKYLTIDKAGKMNCFINNPKLSFLSENIDSQIRNASHHNNISMDFGPGRDEIIYKSGRPPREFKIDYTRYLELCVKIYYDIFAMYAAERILIHR